MQGVVSGLGLPLTQAQCNQLATHFSLLLRWNQKINLTAVRRPQQIATRHFEESLFLLKLVSCAPGLLIDVGSGAGFPGLAVKIACPSLSAVLLEPNHKKATFLKEVIRSCGLENVEVRTQRLEDAIRAATVSERTPNRESLPRASPRGEGAGTEPPPPNSEPLAFLSGYDFSRAAPTAKRTAALAAEVAGRATLVTLRAVHSPRKMLAALAQLLAPQGQLALFLGSDDARATAALHSFHWSSPAPIPHSHRRVILLGCLATESEPRQ
ncbi:MAG: 16S rRNA (guanine(527)-N(7))-methyltransferase RsmG [Acidobacteria bacterium RIFCSPLOWO2_02_FULL_59_13]|nr:MAG: 16S rRNA (guanine(527)-N(7))-methyltransferase RsmG [Acidobacteria bacterium RIFCSPLOWO2_02_FULL_59_13]